MKHHDNDDCPHLVPMRLLESENARLKAEVERLKEVIRREVDGGVDLREEAQRTVEENHKLRAEIERLRASSFVTAVPVEQYELVIKAGDALAGNLPYIADSHLSDEVWVDMQAAWNAAKGGKQS